MKAVTEIFCSMAYLAANSCAMSALFAVFATVERMENTEPGLAVWLFCLLLCRVLLAVFMRKGSSERVAACVCAVAFLLQLVLNFVVNGFFGSFIATLFAAAMWAYSYYSCFELSIKKITAERLTKSFDLCCLVLAFSLFFFSVKALDMVLVLPLAASLFLSLFALMLIHSGEQRQFRTVLLGGSFMLALAFLAAGTIALASGGMKKLVSGTRELIILAAKALEKAFEFLLSLLPQRKYEYVLPEVMDVPAYGEMPDMSVELFDPKLVLIAMLCVGFAIAIVAFVCCILKGHGIIKSHTGRKVNGQRIEKGSFVKKVFSKLCNSLLWHMRRIARHNTSPGLLLDIEARSRRQLHGRGESESCREFLMRAGTVYPHALEPLSCLADAMDAYCFGDGETLSPNEIARMRGLIFGGNK